MAATFSNANGSTTSSSTSMSNASDITTYSVHLPKNAEKNFNVMKFSGNLGVDFSKWTKAEMTRENNSKEFIKEGTKEIPEFGAGSEFGRKQREEARRMKFGMNRKYNYQANNQPWILKSHSNSTKNYKGNREGGVGENAAYYIFTHGDNGTIEAYPLQEWYNFQSVQRYKPLTSEEAEEQFSKRSKCLNYFSIMVKNRLKNDTEDAEGEENKENKIKNKKSTEFKLSEMDEWISSSNESSDEEGAKNDDNSDEDIKSKKKTTKNANNKKKAKRNTSDDVEALEDSDDGDEEGRECEYISSSSESEPDYNLHSVSEEKGLKTILNSDEDDSEDEENEKEAEQNIEQKLENSKKGSDFSSDSDTGENTKVQQSNKKISKKSGKEVITQLCKTVQNSSLKRKQDSIIIGEPNKKLKMESSVRNLPFITEIGITEEVIRKYLTRKPMSSVELISKFKLKRLNNDERKQAEAVIVSILKKIKPKHEIINGKIQFSL